MNVHHHTAATIATAVLAAWVAAPGRAPAQVGETNLSPEEWKRLDTFESHILAKANKTFNEKQWRQAYAEYESFLVEFPRSKTIPFVLLRKGRCLQEDGKLFGAVKDYEEVLDYFPNHIAYAAPALFRIGECHQNKGDLKEAMKAWAEMANDEDYSKHALAALAVNALAENLMKQGEDREAVKYYEQVALQFRISNSAAADHAAAIVTEHYFRTMQEETFRAFYAARRPGDKKSAGSVAPPEEDPVYWKHVLHNVNQYGRFETDQKDLKNKYFTYWIGKMRSRLLDDDGYQLRLIQWQYDVDQDLARWSRSIDEQFERRWRPGDNGRVVWWMWNCSRAPDKVETYYAKIDRSKLTLDHMISLIDFFYRNKLLKRGREIINLVNYDDMSYEEKKKLVFQFYKVDLKDEARIALGKIHYGDLPDERIEALGNELGRAKYEPERMVWVWYRMRDQDRARNLHMRYCHRARQAKDGLPVATALTKVDAYAQDAWMCKADFHKWSREYEDAIAAYRSSDDPPANLWGIVECEVAREKYREAIAQLQEIETFFENDRARAAYAIAEVHHKAGDKARHISALRGVLKKYPKTSESSRAHQRLEALGVKMGGAVDAE